MADTIRRVSPADLQPDQPDSSSIGVIRTRKPRWVSTPPTHAGWWAVRFQKDRLRREILYIDGPLQDSPKLEFSDRAYSWPVEKEESEADGGTQYGEWTRHSPYVQVADDTEELNYSAHSPLWWTTLGILFGILIGVILMFAMEWLSRNHG